jgi:hypothetical protein
MAQRRVFEGTVIRWNPDTGANLVRGINDWTDLPVLAVVVPSMAVGVRVICSRSYRPDGTLRDKVVNGHPFVIIGTVRD